MSSTLIAAPFEFDEIAVEFGQVIVEIDDSCSDADASITDSTFETIVRDLMRAL